MLPLPFIAQQLIVKFSSYQMDNFLTHEHII